MKQSSEIKDSKTVNTRESTYVPQRWDQGNRAKKSRRGRFTKREAMIMVIPALAAIVVVLIAIFATNRGSSYTFSQTGTQYYAGASAPVQQDIKLKVDEDGSVRFSGGKADTDSITTLPVYFDNSRTMVLTTDMLYYMPRSDSYTRFAALSEVNCAENGMINVTRDGKNGKPEAGFLYDGKDFYLFLEPVTVSYMGYTIDLPSLSYAEVRNGGDIMLFNYETKEFTIETLAGTASAMTAYGEYTISLLGDSMTNMNGELTLLMTKPSEIDPIV